MVGTELGDPTAMTLVDLFGDVRGMRILDLAWGRAGSRGSWRAAARE
jgi:hypothetical protein